MWAFSMWAIVYVSFCPCGLLSVRILSMRAFARVVFLLPGILFCGHLTSGIFFMGDIVQWAFFCGIFLSRILPCRVLS